MLHNRYDVLNSRNANATNATQIQLFKLAIPSLPSIHPPQRSCSPNLQNLSLQNLIQVQHICYVRAAGELSKKLEEGNQIYCSSRPPNICGASATCTDFGIARINLQSPS